MVDTDFTQGLDTPRKILRAIYHRYGESILEDSRQFQALFKDLSKGQFIREMNLIKQSFSENIPSDLYRKRNQIPFQMLGPQLVKHLHESLGMERGLAEWVVDSWAIAFDIIQENPPISEKPSSKPTKKTVEAKPTSQPKTASAIHFISNPPGGTVYLGRTKLGVAPITVTISNAQHNFKCRLDGYEDSRKSLSVSQDTTINFNLIRKTESISVATRPIGAAISIDGQHAGYSPLTIPNISHGLHRLTCSMADHQTVDNHINVPTDVKFDLFLIRAPRLTITSSPEGASVIVDGKKKYIGITPFSIKNISDGDHVIEILLTGYETQSKTVRLPNTSKVHFDMSTIQTSNNTININTTPSNAEIYLDGYYKGRTPLSIPNVSQGTHVMTCLLQDHEDYSRNISVPSDLNLNLNLKPIKKPQQTTVPLSVSSFPQGATILIDGNYMGITPLAMINISDGIHQIETDLKGYETQSKTVRLPNISTIHFDLNTIQTSNNTITITTNPSNAEIYIDGYYKGRTPLSIPNVSQGTHVMTCLLQDYEDLSRNISVTNDLNLNLNLTPNKKPQPTHAPISITSYPQGAAVHIDGNYMGVTPLAMTYISDGTHQIEINLKGYETQSKTVRIPFISTVHFDLNKIARPSKKVYPFSITSSPAGAVISIDGKKIGNAPITVSLPIKIYDLKCSLNGYNDVVRQIKIPDNTSSHFSLVKDSKKTQHTHAPVFVTSNPNGADIYLDGKMIGITPQDISSVSFGSHNLLLHLSGYDPVKRIIKIPRDRDISSNLHVKLPPDNSNQSQTPAQNAPISLPLKTSGKNKGLINWALFCIGLLIVGLIVLSITSASYATPKMAPVTDKSATVAVMMPPAVNQSDTVALQTGISLLNSGNYAEALKEFDSALNANPNSVAAWNYKGFSLFKLGRYNESIQASDKAVALDQNYTAAWTQKAIVTIY